MTLNNDECNLRQLFAELTEFFTEYQNRIEKQHIILHLEAMSDPHDNIIITDRVKLKQIFINLLSNAFKFTNAGAIVGGCKIDKNNQLQFYITDTGIGIPKDKQQIIFERFTQLDPGANKLESGTGLGLSIVKGLVNLMGGEIKLESEPNKGSTFSFTISYKEPQPVQRVAQVIEKAIPTNFYNKTILIVEDDLFNAEYLQEILSNYGFNILHTIFGNEAVQIALKDNIDLILMDIRLPDINGYEAISQIRKEKQNIKIIAQTAYASDEERQKALNFGCDDYISKPTEKNLLMEMISRHLSLNG
jgi:hypothetical protein